MLSGKSFRQGQAYLISSLYQQEQKGTEFFIIKN